MEQATSRRRFLGLLAGAPLLAAAPRLACAGEAPLIGRLIQEASALPKIAERMDHISRSLRGIRYQANTLIGGPRHPEVFVVRDDAFDCVTFCEVVLSAARSRNLDEFEAALKRIRYEHDQVRWHERNHYFTQWSRSVVDKGICRPLPMEPSINIEKTLNWGNLGRRRISLIAIPIATFAANRDQLAPGDVIGFVSRRSNLDFYHTGLIAFGGKGEVMLRHASRSRRRILDERMDAFAAVNNVRHVTLLRPVETNAAVELR